MKVCFKCGTVYHIFISYILSISEYKNCSKTLVLTDFTIKSCEDLAARLIDTAEWEEVIVIHEKNTPVEKIESQVNAIIANGIDCLHFFSYGFLSSRIMLNNSHSQTKVILTEEGKMTYEPLTAYQKWRECYSMNDWDHGLEERYGVIDWNRIDEVLVFEPGVYDGSLGKPVREIDMSTILANPQKKEKFINTLNYIFDYHYTDNHFEMIYFDNFLYTMKIIPLESERHFLKKLINATNGYSLHVKLHPGEPSGLADIRFEGLEVNFFDNNNVPWEVIYLNHIIHNGDQKLALITPSSTAVHNSFFIGKYFGISQCYLVLLADLIKDYLWVNIFEGDIEYNNRFIRVYGDKRVFTPQTFGETKQIIRNIFESYPDVATEIDTADKYQEMNTELEWLKKEYANTYKHLPNFICSSRLAPDFGNGYQWDQMVSCWLDTQKTDFTLEFDMISFGKVNKVLWVPYYDRVFGKIQIDRIMLRTLRGEINDFPVDGLNTNGVIDDQHYINFNMLNPSIELEIGKEVGAIIFEGKILFEDSYQKITQFSYTVNQMVHRERELEVVNKRINQNYQLLNKWFLLHQKNRHLGEYFAKHHYQKIVIYGSGQLGKNLYEELHHASIQVVCFVNWNNDTGSICLSGETVTVMGIEDFLKSEDIHDIQAVVVTPVYDFKAIRDALSARYPSEHIISLADTVEFFDE